MAPGRSAALTVLGKNPVIVCWSVPAPAVRPVWATRLIRPLPWIEHAEHRSSLGSFGWPSNTGLRSRYAAAEYPPMARLAQWRTFMSSRNRLIGADATAGCRHTEPASRADQGWSRWSGRSWPAAPPVTRAWQH
jgi:hypothetical protein